MFVLYNVCLCCIMWVCAFTCVFVLYNVCLCLFFNSPPRGVGKLFERKPLRFASSKCFLRATVLPLKN